MATSFTADGTAQAAVTLEWEPVSLTVDGVDVEVTQYEVWLRHADHDLPSLVNVVDGTSATIDGLLPDTTYYVQLRAVAADGTVGVLDDDEGWAEVRTGSEPLEPEDDEDPESELVPVQMLDAPTAPVVTSVDGVATITWDGHLTVPEDDEAAEEDDEDDDTSTPSPESVAPPASFRHVILEVQPAESELWFVVGQPIAAAGDIVAPLTPALEYSFRFRAVDVLGRQSEPSSVTLHAISAEHLRAPAPVAEATATALGYWAGASPVADVTVAWDAVTEGADGEPITVAEYEVWIRATDAVSSTRATATADTEAVISALPIGAEYEVKVRARSDRGVWGEFSAEASVATEAPEELLSAPSEPLISSFAGTVEVRWDGLLGGMEPPLWFKEIRVEMSDAEDGTFTPIGALLNGRKSFPGLGVGTEVWFRFIAIDRLGRASEPSDPDSTIVEGIQGDDIVAGTIMGNRLVAGSIETQHLSPAVGAELDISANGSVNILVGSLATTNDELEALTEQVTQTAMRYGFNADGAVISQPGSEYSLLIRNDAIEMRELGTTLAKWVGSRMEVGVLRADTIHIGRHEITTSPNGTVARWIG